MRRPLLLAVAGDSVILRLADAVDVSRSDIIADAASPQRQAKSPDVALNDIVKVTIALAQPVAFDALEATRATGAFILIDESTHQTIPAGMVDA